VMVGAQLASRILYPLFGPRRLVACGLVGVAVVMTLMTQIGLTTDLWWMRVLMFAMGLTMSQAFISCQAAAFATISLPDTGSASSIFNSGRQLGSAVGVALLATVLAAVGTTQQVDGHTVPNLTAYHAAFVTSAGIALIGAAIALTIRDADAASTMVRRLTTKVPARSPTPTEASPQGAG